MNNNTLILPSPAKLNLFLHIVGRRADGYHNLQTVFQFIDYCDTLHFSACDSLVLENSLPGVDDTDNLIIKAANLLKAHTGCEKGARICLEKRIPMGSGLGGGSSNAATTLLALNQLWQLNLTREELLPLGRKLGADVGIFLYGHAAFAEGIGDEFAPIELSEPWYVVVVPPVHVSTIAMYTHPDLIRNTPKINKKEYIQDQITANDFSPLVCKEYPLIAQTLNWLSQFGPARLTGSGAGLFLPCKNPQQAQDIVGQIPNGMIGFAAQGKNLSPLQTR